MVRKLDAAIILVLLVFGLSVSRRAAANQGQTVPPLGYVLVVTAVLLLLIARQWPVRTFLASTTVTLVYLALFAYGPIMFATMAAAVGLAMRSPLRHTLVAVGAALVAGAGLIGWVCSPATGTGSNS